MKTPVKAVITTDTKTFYGDKVLHLQLDGKNWEEVEHFIKLRGLKPGAVVVLQLKDKFSKSQQQNATYRLLLQIAMSSKLFGDNYKHLHCCMKFTYGGLFDDWVDPNGKWHSDLRSTSNYDMEQMSKLISGTLESILSKFNENDYYDKRLDEMMQTFNSGKIESKPEELEIF